MWNSIHLGGLGPAWASLVAFLLGLLPGAALSIGKDWFRKNRSKIAISRWPTWLNFINFAPVTIYGIVVYTVEDGGLWIAAGYLIGAFWCELLGKGDDWWGKWKKRRRQNKLRLSSSTS